MKKEIFHEDLDVVFEKTLRMKEFCWLNMMDKVSFVELSMAFKVYLEMEGICTWNVCISDLMDEKKIYRYILDETKINPYVQDQKIEGYACFIPVSSED